MATIKKKNETFLGMGIVPESYCLFGRKIGNHLDRSEKGDQPNIHRHENTWQIVLHS